jgi:hypothetical protein
MDDAQRVFDQLEAEEAAARKNPTFSSRRSGMETIMKNHFEAMIPLKEQATMLLPASADNAVRP